MYTYVAIVRRSKDDPQGGTIARRNDTIDLGGFNSAESLSWPLGGGEPCCTRRHQPHPFRHQHDWLTKITNAHEEPVGNKRCRERSLLLKQRQRDRDSERKDLCITALLASSCLSPVASHPPLRDYTQPFLQVFLLFLHCLFLCFKIHRNGTDRQRGLQGRIQPGPRW